MIVGHHAVSVATIFSHPGAPPGRRATALDAVAGPVLDVVVRQLGR